MRMKFRINAFVHVQFIHAYAHKHAWFGHELCIKVTMIVGTKSMKHEPKFPNFMCVARENLFCFENEHGMILPRAMKRF